MKLKICGMKYKANIKAIAALKPDYMGFIFYENSVRCVIEKIPQIPEGITKVGVFVNARLEVVQKAILEYDLEVVQLHGTESTEYCHELKTDAIEIIKAFSVKDQFDFSELTPYEPHVNYFLFDTKGTNPGGNGFCFDWEILKNYNSETPYFLSGGIGIKDIEKLKTFRSSKIAEKCHAVDVNSKFELQPAYKDPIKLKSFIQKL
jgi:phosphoribosylanthranilate isomerase